MLKSNEGTLDRVIRIALGITLLALVFFGPRTPWGWIGLLPLATGLMGWCPLYAALGLDTLGKKPATR